MPHLEWKPIYLTGIDSVDIQHLKIVEYMNGFFQANAEKDLTTAQKTLDSLIQFTKKHFLEEEALMASKNYPEIADHKNKHTHLLETVSKLSIKYKDNPNGENATALSSFLKSWLVTHILLIDKKYVPFATR